MTQREIRERDVVTRKSLRFTRISLTLVPKLLPRLNEIDREEYVDNVTLYKFLSLINRLIDRTFV